MKKKILKILFLSIIGILIIPWSSFELVVMFSSNLSLTTPSYYSMHEENETNRYYSNGHIVNYLNEDEIPEYVLTYLVTLEDQNFYKHPGYDIKRILKSTIDNIKSKEIVAGGSTLTQQLARLLYLNNDKSYLRKFKELYYARRIEKELSKKEILVLYLNLAYFGENLYGIDAASKSFFGCNGNEINKSQTVLLLSLLPSPNNYSPRVNLSLSKQAYNKAIDNLYYRNAITEKEASELFSSFPKILENNIALNNPDSYYYQAIDHLMESNGYNTKTSSFEVNTYLDRNLQEEVYSYINEIVTEKDAQASVVIMEPSSGNIKVLIGGKNDFSFNRAISTNKDIGSSCKPILYTIALENGFDPLDTFTSEPTTFYLSGGTSYSPHNAGNKYAYRKINMVEALSTSDNIYALKLALVLGSLTLSNKMKLLNINIEPNITNALGSFSLSLLELTSIYNALANDGIYNEPRFFETLKVNGTTKNNLRHSFQLFEKEKSRIMSYLLRSTYDPSLNTYSTPTMLYYPLDKQFAVKTGTTNSAAFVIGYTPNITIGIYVGKDDDSTLNDPSAAKRLFKKVANTATHLDSNIFFSTNSLTPFRLHNTSNNKSSFIYYR